jgi:hypothetical protein
MDEDGIGVVVVVGWKDKVAKTKDCAFECEAGLGKPPRAWVS